MESILVKRHNDSSSGSLKDLEKPDHERNIDTAYGVDEKGSYADEKVDSVDTSDVGDVFADGPRLIDLGDDGKERPIGMACLQ